MIARLLEWVALHPDFADVGAMLASESSVSSTSRRRDVVAPARPDIGLSDSYVPPVVECLVDLAAGAADMLAECRAQSLEPSVEFEKRVAAAFGLLGLEVEKLGQGAGRVADGIARERSAHWAVIYDAKIRQGGYAMRTEDRKFREYIDRHAANLTRDGVDTVYFCVISSSFNERDVDAALDVVRTTKAKAFVLLEARALVAAVERSLRERVFDDRASLQRFFATTRIIRESDVPDVRA